MAAPDTHLLLFGPALVLPKGLVGRGAPTLLPGSCTINVLATVLLPMATFLRTMLETV